MAALIGNCFFLGHSNTKCGPPHSKQPLLTNGVRGDVVVVFLVDDDTRPILLVQLVRDGSPRAIPLPFEVVVPTQFRLLNIPP